MKVAYQFVLITFLFGVFSIPGAQGGCLQHGLQNLWNTYPKSVQKEEKLKQMYEELNQAYSKGGELQKLRYEIMDLKRIPNAGPDDAKKLNDIQIKYQSITSEITFLNDSYIKKMHDLYKADGLPSLLVTGEDRSLSLVLDFTAPPTTQAAFEFYRKVKNRFGLDKVTLNLKENVELGSAGFFSASAKRIEMGPGQGFSLLEDYFNTVSKHESRHSMFFAKRNKGYDSIFHARFFASPDGNLLNQDKIYDTFMSAEELYTFSTDFQSLGQVFKGEFVTDLAKREALMNQIVSHQDMFKKVASAHEKISLDMMSSLDDLLKSKNKKQFIHMAATQDGNWTLRMRDKLHREAEIVLVGQDEKLLAEKFIDLNEKSNAQINLSFEKKLKAMGFDIEAIGKKIESNKLTPEESATLNKIYEDYIQSPEGLAMINQLDLALEPVIQNAKKMMSDINELAVIQVKEADELERLINLYSNKATGGQQHQLKALRDQMFRTAKNVKEGYKGFAIGP